MKLGLLVQITSEGHGTDVFSFNKDEAWAKYASDVRTFIKSFPSRRELEERGKNTNLSFDESEKSVIFLRFLGHLGYFICLVKARPEGSGRPNDNTAAWIYVPSDVMLSGQEAVSIINEVEVRISGRYRIDKDSLQELFTKDHATSNIIPAVTNITSNEEGFGARYYGKGTEYELYELLGNGLAQHVYNKYRAIFLLNNDDGLCFDGEVIKDSLKPSSVIYPPETKDGFIPFLDGTQFITPVEKILGDTLKFKWCKDGYQEIVKECVVRSNVSNNAPIEFNFSDSEKKWGVRREHFHVYCEQKEIVKCSITVEGQPLKDIVWVSESKRKTGIKVDVSCEGYKDFHDTVELSGKIIIPMSRITYKYRFAIPIHIDNKNIGEQIVTVESQYKIKKSPIEGYDISKDYFLEGERNVNILKYDNVFNSIKHFAYGFITCVAIIFIFGIYSTWDDWDFRWGIPPFRAVDKSTKIIENDPVEENKVNNDSINAITYLDNNDVWRKDSLENNPFTNELFDDLNYYKIDKLNEKYRLAKSEKFNSILKAIDECKNKDIELSDGQYTTDSIIDLNEYIKKFRCKEEDTKNETQSANKIKKQNNSSATNQTNQDKKPKNASPNGNKKQDSKVGEQKPSVEGRQVPK